METHLGLTPEEMITVFNRMYLDVWEKTKGNINWELANISKQLKEGKEVDISRLLLEVFEVVITATRDGFVVSMYENNERIFNDLKMTSQHLMDGEEMDNPLMSGMSGMEDDEEPAGIDVPSV